MVRFARSSCLSLSVTDAFRLLYRSLYSVILSTELWFVFVSTYGTTQLVTGASDNIAVRVSSSVAVAPAAFCARLPALFLL